MIAIVNIGPHDDPDSGGLRNYEVRINDRVICKFQHYRRDGLAECLAIASEAIDICYPLEMFLGISDEEDSIR